MVYFILIDGNKVLITRTLKDYVFFNNNLSISLVYICLIIYWTITW